MSVYYLCPACPTSAGTIKQLVAHARHAHGLTQSEAKGGWNRPKDWDQTNSLNCTRRFRPKVAE